MDDHTFVKVVRETIKTVYTNKEEIVKHFGPTFYSNSLVDLGALLSAAICAETAAGGDPPKA